MTQTFAADVEAFAKNAQERLEMVFRESTQRVIGKMQEVGPSVTNPDSTGAGHMPVASGFLRASLVVSKTEMPSINPSAGPVDGAKYKYAEPAVSLVIAGADLGDTIFAGYTASYAMPVHFGANGGPAYNWVTLAAQHWQSIVTEVANEVRAQTS